MFARVPVDVIKRIKPSVRSEGELSDTARNETFSLQTAFHLASRTENEDSGCLVIDFIDIIF
jgi:hypothetical protein